MIFHSLSVRRALLGAVSACSDRRADPTADGAADDCTVTPSEFISNCRTSGPAESTADSRVKGGVVRMNTG